MIDYSVIIRTTGKAGEKYRKLLSSITALEPQPKEVIVVLPDGYDLPEDQLGWETFYHCPKGMINGDAVSFIDSDDTLEPDMYELLVKTTEEHGADISHCG